MTFINISTIIKIHRAIFAIFIFRGILYANFICIYEIIRTLYPLKNYYFFMATENLFFIVKFFS